MLKWTNAINVYNTSDIQSGLYNFNLNGAPSDNILLIMLNSLLLKFCVSIFSS